MYVAFAVAVGDPNVAVAAVALSVDGDERGRVVPLPVDGQVRLGRSDDDLPGQRGFDDLAGEWSGARRVVVALLEPAFAAIVGDSQVLGAAFFDQGDAVGVGHG